ncbi:MAG: hypothetical protein CML20_10155 [Rheinheimera sp.]|uniref:hypothetical protein n=1 Tax=Arsukibacterium sp. UBA3155 TaxID=1946058 RepID=UPI000C8F530F|nr:hypothetical protein [Arsukibacterium sp. UBA3155]MAD75135.1 hypothetical protein [Rheinheimera sp.]|tara:strand:- start:48773 stop:48991 length:219 start_codon:yes stop_codon:yes gene_type:complete
MIELTYTQAGLLALVWAFFLSGRYTGSRRLQQGFTMRVVNTITKTIVIFFCCYFPFIALAALCWFNGFIDLI